MSNFEKLLNLMQENPELPVVPMVNYEVCGGDECANWLGEWGSAEKTRYILGEERVFFYDECDMETALEEIKGWEWYEDATDEEALEEYRALAWIDCIAVYIGPL